MTRAVEHPGKPAPSLPGARYFSPGARLVALSAMIRLPVLLFVLGVPVAAAAASARCTLPDTDLALVFDSSHSISDADFTLEKEGIAGALEDPSKTPHDGSVCVTVIEFHRRAAVRVPYRCITSASDAASIAADVRAIAKPRGDNETGVDIALDAASDELSVNGRAAARQVIVLATDGLPNVTEASCNVRPVAECPPCASLDAAIAAVRAGGIDELHLVTVEDRDNRVGPLVADDFERFYGCRAFSAGDDSAGAVVTVRDFEEFTRVVADTVAGAGCGTRVDLSQVTALPGGTARMTASLTTGAGTSVRAAGVDLAVDAELAATSCGGCEVAPGVEGTLGCTASPNGLRATVEAHAGDTLADGPLLVCRFGISPTVVLGSTIAVENRPHAVSADGATLATVGRDGIIEVTSCPREPGACAAGGSALRVARIRFARTTPSTTAMRLRAAVSGADLAAFDSTGAVVFLRLGGDDEAGTCAEVPLAAFQRRGKRKLVFRGSIDSAKGLDRIVLRSRPDGTLRVRVRGRRLELIPPEPGVLHLQFGIREPDGQPDLCPGADASLRSARKRAVVFP
jgi:hypothetical protein